MPNGMTVGWSVPLCVCFVVCFIIIFTLNIAENTNQLLARLCDFVVGSLR